MRPVLAARVRAGAALAAGALLLAACSSSGAASEPTWRPKPSFSGEGYEPPVNPQPVEPGGPTPGPGSPDPSSSGRTSNGDGAVVAKHLVAPTAVTIMPDNTALVGERTTGRIVRVQPLPGRPVQVVRTIPGISTAGDGGLLDLAISPNYAEDNLIFGYITTATDNRVIAFTLKGPITTVLSGIPRGRNDNTGRLAFAADGSLLVGTGDAGRPALASNPNSLAGKVLRITDIGTPAKGNPVPGSRVYASGLVRTDGLCVVPDTTSAVQVEGRPTTVADPVFRVRPGGEYGGPTPGAAADQPLASLPQTGRAPGGCAVLKRVLYVTSLDGKALLAAAIKRGVGSNFSLTGFTALLVNKYGRLHTVVAAADGALWLTTSNRDGKGKPVPDDERVLRIMPSGGGAGDSHL